MKKMIQFATLGVVLGLIGCKSLMDTVYPKETPANQAVQKN